MLRNLRTYLCVGAGGFLGTILRFWISGDRGCAGKIAGFPPFLDEVVKDGLVTLQEAPVIKYHGGVAKT